MRKGPFLASLVAVCCLGNLAAAGDPADCSSGQCPSTSAASATCEGGQCPISQAVAVSMKKLPQMTYLVGSEKTHCSKTAAKLAESQSEKVQYQVGERTYADQGKAMDALIADTETMLTSFTTPKTCHVSGTTTIAGESCGCKVMAGQYARQVEDAVKKVRVSYLVGTDACDCPTTSLAMAKERGIDRTFVVGETKTTCSKTARLAYARARYQAAAKAIAQAKLSQGSNT